MDYIYKYKKYKTKYFKLLHGGSCLRNVDKCATAKYPLFDNHNNRCCNNEDCTICDKPFQNIFEPFINLPQENIIQNIINDYVHFYGTDNKDNIEFKFPEGEVENDEHRKMIGEIYTKIIGVREDGIEDEYKCNEMLAVGGHSGVFLYKGPGNLELIVKYGDINNDIKCIKILNQGECTNLIVENIILEHQNIKCLIMPHLNGTILDLIIKRDGHMSYKLCLDILYSIVTTINCLKRSGLFYSDLKLPNVFYSILDIGNPKIKIMLGDFGSVDLKGTGAISTYPPIYELFYDMRNDSLKEDYEDDDPEGKWELFHSEKLIAWEIGIVTLDLLNVEIWCFTKDDVKQLYYDEYDALVFDPERFDNKLHKYINTIIESNAEKIDFFMDLVKGTVCRPEHRWSLDRIVDWILEKTAQNM